MSDETIARFIDKLNEATISDKMSANSQNGGVNVIIELSNQHSSVSLRDVFTVARECDLIPTDGDVTGTGSVILRFVENDE